MDREDKIDSGRADAVLAMSPEQHLELAARKFTSTNIRLGTSETRHTEAQIHLGFAAVLLLARIPVQGAGGGGNPECGDCRT